MPRAISGRVMSRWSMALCLGIFAIAEVCPQRADAQATATVSGSVRDSSGAVLPDANIVLHDTATNLDRTTSTNSIGYYVIPQIQPGTYELRVSKNGFRTEVRPNLTLVVNQTATLDFSLPPGETRETIQVQATAPLLETVTSELGEAVVKRQVNELPLNGRNFTQLLNLTPGVSTVNVSQNSATSGGVWSNPIGTFSYPAVNGQSNRSNLFLLDGVNNQGSFGSTYAVPPIVDDIDEFKVQSHNDDASFGGVLGGVVNVVTKSGTSQYHGSAWEFLRNKSLDAGLIYPLLPTADQTAPSNQPGFQQNQFGATFGGPLPIPGEHQKKTFFFLSYEGFRNHTAASNQYITPTTTQLAGDLTGISGQ